MYGILKIHVDFLLLSNLLTQIHIVSPLIPNKFPTLFEGSPSLNSNLNKSQKLYNFKMKLAIHVLHMANLFLKLYCFSTGMHPWNQPLLITKTYMYTYSLHFLTNSMA